MTQKQNFLKKQNKTKQKESKEIHTCNSLDGSFDKDFHYGFQKHKIAQVILRKKKKKQRRVRLYLVTVFVIYFQKLIFGNIKKKEFSCIFETKNMFG